MKRWKDECDKHGKVWEAIRMDSSYIFARTRSDQDIKLAEVSDNIRKASAVGVKVVTMHWTLIPIRRNGHTNGRGGSNYHEIGRASCRGSVYYSDVTCSCTDNNGLTTND